MTTTVSVLINSDVELPADFRKRNKIKPSTSLRVTEVGDGLHVTPLAEPTEKELHAVIAAAGSLTRQQSTEDEDMPRETIAETRVENLNKSGTPALRQSPQKRRDWP